VAADTKFRAALQSLATALDELSVPSMIVGGIAVIAAGVPRQTIDIDATILGRDADLELILKTFERCGIVPRILEARQFARDRQLLLLKHAPSDIPIDVAFAWLPFEEEALSLAQQLDVEGVSLRIARPEDLIIYKVAAWRDRDRSDIERLLALHLEDIDLDRVRGLIVEIGLALDDPSRIEEFGRMVGRARKTP
jgi:hypothetical protein